KSTALRLLAGEIAPDGGDVRLLGRASLGYLRQSQSLKGAGSVREALFEPFAEVRHKQAELVKLEVLLAADPGGDSEAHAALLQRYGELQESYARDGGYEIESRLKRLIADVDFPEADLDRSVETLSGGERGRLELAKVLVQKPDLLLLDEPTNHLDLAAIERLESFLNEYQGAFVLVSHDRAFIQRTCREIVELEGGRFVRYPFGYDRYARERAARLERARQDYERQKEHVEKTEDFIRRNLAGQRTKQAQSRRKMLEKLERLERPDDHWELAGQISLRFSTGGELGAKETLRAPRLTVGYPGKPILQDVDVNIYRGDRVGIMGPNGCGKSTLLKTLVGELPPLAGQVERGSGVLLGYYDQKLSSLDEDRSLIEEIRSIKGDQTPDVVRSYLAKFRFFGDDAFRSVRSLSGGERSRLSLAKMMLYPRNVLALDEPTNHLDIPAREVLEEALRNFAGTIIVVSHDRYFIDQVCTRLLVVNGTSLEMHLGNYSDLRSRREQGAKAAPPPPPRDSTREGLPKSVAAGGPNPSSRPSGKAPASNEGRLAAEARQRQRLERRATSLAEECVRLEAERAAVRLALTQDHAGDWAKLHELAARDQALEELIERRKREADEAAQRARNMLEKK
ncbi:MAG TPA: ATP-binding cassette domain-containing protein, partial [Polyangia bacterium]